MPRDTKLSEPTECRLLIDPPADGAWNMAVDEALLEEVATTDQPVLRFYQWLQPTLSLGYFQSVAGRALHPASKSADVVRRLSGGGAILHDRELTYSFIVPATHELARETQQLYDCVHQAIVERLRTHLPKSGEWQPVLCCQLAQLLKHEEPFLCFQRRSKGDILLQRPKNSSDPTTHKIVGSAQRRRRGTVLQHGSILLGQSDLAPELPGINEIANLNLEPSDLITSLAAQVATTADLALSEGKHSESLLAKIRQLQQAKYQSATWTDRR